MQKTRFYLTILLWVGAGLLAAYLLFKQQNGGNIRLEFNDVQNMTEAELSAKAVGISASTMLLEPRFTGRDADGQTWEVIAKTASRSGEMGDDHIYINHVTATFTLANQHPLTLLANTGEYHKTQDMLEMKGNVQATGLGLQLNAPHITTNVATRALQAAGPVTIQGLIGGWQSKLTGTQLLLNDASGLHLTLQGRVTGQFFPTPHSKTETR